MTTVWSSRPGYHSNEGQPDDSALPTNLVAMSAVRFAAVILTMLVFAPAANAGVAAPTGLKPFLLRADEGHVHSFPRTPSFAWKPVRGAVRYEFELATKRKFNESTLLWRSETLKTPTAAIPVALPWMTGSPYALWAHVRAVTRKGVTKWSAPYGFNMRWSNLPRAELSPPGLVRWSTVEGATGYQVWFLGPRKRIATKTNVADEREHWTLHQDSGWTGVVRWRVRAIRSKVGLTQNGIPAVSYGPWSQTFVELNPPISFANMSLSAMVSDAYTVQPTPFRLMPSMSFSGNLALKDEFQPGTPRQLYRTYISTDVDCVNIVYKGSIVGSPAWAPRTTGPLVLPGTQEQLEDITGTSTTPGKWLVADGAQLEDYSVDNAKVQENESLKEVAPGAEAGGGTSGTPTSDEDKAETAALSPPLVDLWDNGWPEHRYYYTVVPVGIFDFDDNGKLEYWDTELPQDVCAAGRVFQFGKVSEAVVATAGAAPYVSGLSTTGRLFTATRAKPSVYGAPLVAWKPALGADRYELQWSKRAYPWAKVGSLETPSTSALLPLTPGSWHYRVRGISLALPAGGRQMSWSDPVALRVAKPKFRIVRR